MRKWFKYFSCILGVILFALPVSSWAQDILIINSFREDLFWADELSKRISMEMKQKYPEASIHLTNLNANKAQRHNALYANFRTSLSVINDIRIDPTLVLPDEFFPALTSVPDILIIVGEETWNIFKRCVPWLGSYTEVPIILTAVTDSLSQSIWDPGRTGAFSRYSFAPTENASELSIIYSIKQKGYSTEKITETTLDKGFEYKGSFDVTSIILPDIAGLNTEFILELMPDVKEILFIDNPFLTSLQHERKLRNYISEHHNEIGVRRIDVSISNADSIFNIMLEKQENRAIITHSFEVDPTFSRRTQRELDSLFSNILTTPIFSLMEQRMLDNYIVGGRNFSIKECTDNVLYITDQIFTGKKAVDIPSVYLKESRTFINESAFIRFGFDKKFITANDPILFNKHPSFFKKNEVVIYTFIIILAILSGFALLSYRRNKHLRTKQIESDKYKTLYDELQLIYQNTLIDFAIYDSKGEVIVLVKNNDIHGSRDFISINLFQNPYLSESDVNRIISGEEVNTEISISPDIKTNIEEKYQIIISPMNEESDKDEKYSLVLIDLSPVIIERKEREKIENLMKFACDTFKVGIASYNLITGTGFANEAWYSNLNEERSDNINNEYSNVISSDRVPVLDVINKMKLGETEPFQKDIQVKVDNDLYRWVRQYIFQTRFDPEGGVITIVELNINIDAQKISEIELGKAQKEAEQSNRETEEFLANISHEIRTPLNAIVGFSSLIATMDDPEETTELASIVKKNNQLLLQLINDIVELSKCDAGRIEFNNTNINIKNLITGLRGYAKRASAEKQIEIKIDIPEEEYMITSDSIYLKHIFHHLISNSVKFTDSGSITIGYFAKEQYFYFFVEDTGVGIPKEKQELVFKRFEKINPFIQGSGLGLSLCKSILTALGGEIGIISEPEKGTKFWFILPRKQD